VLETDYISRLRCCKSDQVRISSSEHWGSKNYPSFSCQCQSVLGWQRTGRACGKRGWAGKCRHGVETYLVPLCLGAWLLCAPLRDLEESRHGRWFDDWTIRSTPRRNEAPYQWELHLLVVTVRLRPSLQMVLQMTQRKHPSLYDGMHQWTCQGLTKHLTTRIHSTQATISGRFSRSSRSVGASSAFVLSASPVIHGSRASQTIGVEFSRPLRRFEPHRCTM